MKYILFEGFAVIYSIFGAYLMAQLLSQIVYGKCNNPASKLGLICLWPLMALSGAGRKKLTTILKKGDL